MRRFPVIVFWLMAFCAAAIVSACLFGSWTARGADRPRLRLARATTRIATNAAPVPAITNVMLFWSYSGPTNTDVVIYSTTNLLRGFGPGGWRNEAILPSTQTNIVLRITDRARFFHIVSYDPVSGMVSGVFR